MKGDVKLRIPRYLAYYGGNSALRVIQFPSGSKYEGLGFFILRNKTKDVYEWKGDKVYCHVDITLNPDLTTSVIDSRGFYRKYIKTISYAEVIEELSAYVCE